MAVPASLMIHTCTVTHYGTNGLDEYGIPIDDTTTTTGIACRFVAPKGGIRVLESGEHVTALPGVLLPTGTVIAEGDTVSAGPAGFDKTYRVQAVKAVYGPTKISHIKAELEAT